ncbi:MAG: helicase HerA-like domain-containing protein, partial [Candidatus Phaeomarinobacter sp.]
IRPPKSRLGPATPEDRTATMAASPSGSSYDASVDREAAYEILQKRRAELEAERAKAEKAATAEKERKEREKAEARARPRASRRQGATEAFVKSMMRQVGRTLGRELIRGILGSLKR